MTEKLRNIAIRSSNIGKNPTKFVRKAKKIGRKCTVQASGINVGKLAAAPRRS